MSADVAGAAAPAASTSPLRATADVRQKTSTQPGEDAGNLFDARLDTALAAPEDGIAADAHPKSTGPKPAQAEDMVESDTDEAGQDEQPPVAFVLTPWLVVPPCSDFARDMHVPGAAQQFGRKTTAQQDEDAVAGDDASGAPVSSPDASAVPTTTVMVALPQFVTPAVVTPLVTAPIVEPPVTPPATSGHQRQQIPPAPEAVVESPEPDVAGNPPTPPSLANAAGGDTPGDSGAATGAAASLATAADPITTAADPITTAVARPPVLPPAPLSAPHQAPATAGRNAWRHRSDVADARAAAVAPGEARPDAPSPIQAETPSADAGAAHNIESARLGPETPAPAAGKAIGRNNGRGEKLPTPADARTTGATVPEGLPYVAAPEPTVQEPAAVPRSPHVIHVASPVAVAAAGLPRIDPAVWTPSEAAGSPTLDVPDPDTHDRLVESLRMQFVRGGGDAVVQLRPEHLGPVTVSLRVEQGGVSARITTADPVVAEWLEAHQNTLRDGLQANGLSLERLVIDRDGRSPERRERREPPARRRFRTPAERQSTFELTI